MKRIIAVWLIIMMLMDGLVGFVNLSTDVEGGNRDAEIRSASKSELTSHYPFSINGNTDFTFEHGVSNPTAAGTQDDPYIIENWNINASTAHGIYITNANAYFIIRNCVIHDGESNSKYGIYFYNTTSGKVENCTVYNNYYGILLDYSSNNNIISNCTVYNNSEDGILLWGSSNNNITNCIVYSNWDGIELGYSSNNNITNCTVYNNSDYGIFLVSSSNNNIIGNTFTNDGIFILYPSLDDCVQTIENNTVNGKPLYYFLNENAIILNTAEVGQLILVNCTSFIIRDLDISYTCVGIHLLYSSNNQIINCTVYNNSGDYGVGVWLDSSSNNNITNCDVYNNWYGIDLDYSSDNTITNCTVYNNSYGIGLYYSSNNIITNCTLYNNDYGIYLYKSSNNNITNCDVYNNYYYGILLGSSSNNNQITNCDVYNNYYYGILLRSSSDNNIITNCTIYNNFEKGIWMYSSSNNQIHYNNIYNNTYYGVYNYNTESQYAANATYNWWGSADGPSGVGLGSGDAVSDNVIYDPWLIEDYHHPLITIISPQEGGLITNQNVILIYIVDLPLTSTCSPIEYNIIGPANNTTYDEEKIYNIIISVTDRAGNTATANVAFTIDKTEPIIDITSVANNTYYNTSVTPVIEVLDINLNINIVTLNSVPFASGNTVTEDGDYILMVQATDKAGNTASKSVSFTIDKTKPEIIVTGIADNAYYNVSVTPVVDITDLNPNTTLITLNGETFTSGDTVTEEGGYVLFVQATDKANNTATKTVSFSIDKTKPNVTVTGVEEGVYYNVSVTPVIGFSDTNLNVTTITLSGFSFESGKTITEEDIYVLVAHAEDKAGNTATKTISFIIDKTKPTITITSPAEGLITNQDVTLNYTVSDRVSIVENISVTGDESPYIEEGNYSIMLTATDQAGNTAQDTVTFIIDKTKPGISELTPATGTKTTDNSIVVSGKTEPGADVKINGIAVSVDSDGSFSKEITLAKGENTITITATDRAGNTNTQTIIVTKTEKEKPKGFIPGFETFLLLIVLTGCGAVGIKRRKKASPPEKPVGK